MSTDLPSISVSKSRFWTGTILSGLVVLFLVFDGATKVVKVAPVIEACEKLGIPSGAVPGIGLLLLVCTAVYTVPKTAVLGAILLTGYLGGATAIHLRAESGMFPIVFAVMFGLLVWLGLVLREPRLLGMFLRRWSGPV